MNRRHALKWLTGTAAGGAAAPALGAPDQTEPAPPAYPIRFNLHDPDFSKITSGPWPRLLREEETVLVKLLADLILPKDANGPAASEVGVPDFIDEWISAPYEANREACETIRGGLAWLNTESFRRHGGTFVSLSIAQQTDLLDAIAYSAKADPELRIGHAFFREFRQLCLGGYYTHSSTWKHLGYVGNVTLGGPYPGVPLEIIQKLGLEDVA